MVTGIEEIHELDQDIRRLKKALKDSGVPSRLVSAISTRALRSGRRTTGEFQSNRASRWNLPPKDPQYGTERDCKLILLRLLATLLEFEGAPRVPPDVTAMLEHYLERPLQVDGFRDELTLEKLSYKEIAAEAESPRAGMSGFHIGHRDPTREPKHTPDNVEWRTDRSNLIQGNMTLRDARTRFVELIARYFALGEVTITRDGSL